MDNLTAYLFVETIIGMIGKSLKSHFEGAESLKPYAGKIKHEWLVSGQYDDILEVDVSDNRDLCNLITEIEKNKKADRTPFHAIQLDEIKAKPDEIKRVIGIYSEIANGKDCIDKIRKVVEDTGSGLARTLGCFKYVIFCPEEKDGFDSLLGREIGSVELVVRNRKF